MTHKLYEYECEYLKHVPEYTSTEYFCSRSDSDTLKRSELWYLRTEATPGDHMNTHTIAYT